MVFFDLPLEQLESYRAPDAAPLDFDSFWATTLAEAAARPLDVSFAPADYGLQTVETWDVTLAAGPINKSKSYAFCNADGLIRSDIADGRQYD